MLSLVDFVAALTFGEILTHLLRWRTGDLPIQGPHTGSRTVAAAKIKSIHIWDFDASTLHIDPLFFIDRSTYLRRMLPSLFNFKDSEVTFKVKFFIHYVVRKILI